MLDANGINMHHDAITGTSETGVYFDYLQVNERANNANNKVFAESMGEVIDNQFGFMFSEDWVKYDSIETINHYYPTESNMYTLLNDTSSHVTVAL